MINYFYDEDQGIYELYFNDTLLVELTYCGTMTFEEAENLADTLYNQYLEAQK